MKTTWENNVRLSDVCEPYYRLAKSLSKDFTVTEDDGQIKIETAVGCERYGQPENGGKCVCLSTESSVYKGDVSVCKNCAIASKTPYCPLKLAQYIRYMEQYQPEEEKRQRAIRDKDLMYSVKGYETMPATPYPFSFRDLAEMRLEHDALIAAKCLIDKIITLPSFKTKDDYVECSFRCTPEVAKALSYGTLDLERIRANDWQDVIDYNKEPVLFNIKLPKNPAVTKQVISEALCGKNELPNNIYVMFYIIIVYSLLQRKMYLPYLLDLALNDESRNERLRHHFGYPYPPLLKSKTRFYGLLETNDTEADETVPLDVASYLRENCGLNLPIRKMTMQDFANLFTYDVKDGHNDNMSIGYKEPEAYTVYVLDELANFLDYVPQAKHNGATYDRAKTVWAVINFFGKMKDGYYILLCGNKKELDNILETSRLFPWVFGQERLVLKDYTDKEMARAIHSRYPAAGYKKTLAFLEKNKKRFPFHNEKLIGYIGNYYETHNRFPEEELPTEKTYQEQLDALTGLSDIKEQAKRLCNLWKYMKQGKENGLSFPSINTHMLFKGNPGTGKTTVARILANAMYDYGACRERKLVEVHCPDLVAGYVGQTALKTRKKIEKAIGGVLFVDEAYALTQSRGGFGDESLAVLVKMMEDHRDELTVIFAGYPDEMEHFMDANPGLRSRIGYTFDFKDYTKKELVEIFETKMKDCHFTVSGDAKKKAEAIIRNEIGKPHFGNGRFIDKLVQEVFMEKAQRDTFSTVIQEEDIPDAMFSSKTNHSGKTEIGFKP